MFYTNKVSINDKTSKWHQEQKRSGHYHIDVYNYIITQDKSRMWILVDSYDFGEWEEVQIWLEDNIWKNRTFIKNNTHNKVNFNNITLAKPWEHIAYK